MAMGKFWIGIILVLMFFGGCSHLPRKEDPKGYSEALELMKKGDVYKAVKLFELLCGDGHQISCWASGKQMVQKPQLSIMQGGTDSDSVQFVVAGPKDQTMEFLVRHKKTGRVSREFKKDLKTRSHSDYGLFSAHFKNLKASGKSADSYELAISIAGGQILDLRSFRLLNASQKNINFAVTSCMQESYETEQKQQWKDLLSLKPEVIFMIGDNVYVDIKSGIFSRKVTPDLIWNRYMDARLAFQVFYEPQLTPVFAVWDDHDYGVNDGDGSFAHKAASQKVFEAFFPQDISKVVLAKGPGVSRLLGIAGQYFLLLDNRSFRTSPGVKKDQAHFGADQEDWLFEQFKAHPGPFWLISGDQFFGGYHPFESYQGNHPMAFDRFMYKLRKSKRRYAFVSGDRHLSELMKLPSQITGFQTYELTSSGIHSKMYPGSLRKWPNPLAIEAVDGVMNYMLIESRPRGRGMAFKVSSYGLGKKLLFSKDLTVK